MSEEFDGIDNNRGEEELAADSDSITEKDAINFALGQEQVASFLEEGPLLEKVAKRVPTSDFSRLQREYPTLFPTKVYRDPARFAIFAVTFIRGRPDAPGYVKMKLYIDMASLRVLKVLATK
jgi:hypothetical protein